jgi:hypothetical protein
MTRIYLRDSNTSSQLQYWLLAWIHLGLLLPSTVPIHNYNLKSATFYTNSQYHQAPDVIFQSYSHTTHTKHTE